MDQVCSDTSELSLEPEPDGLDMLLSESAAAEAPAKIPQEPSGSSLSRLS